MRSWLRQPCLERVSFGPGRRDSSPRDTGQAGPPGASGLHDGDVSCLFPDQSSVQVDPAIKNGRNYVVDVSWQRELPQGMVMDISYAGRFGRDLQQGVSLTQSPIMYL